MPRSVMHRLRAELRDLVRNDDGTPMTGRQLLAEAASFLVFAAVVLIVLYGAVLLMPAPR